jgi:DHA1 family tetracycline resistance protein-like MFS transporter
MIPMLPFFARSFGSSAFEVGLLMSAYSVMQILVAPIWGQISDRWGRRPVLLITILGQGLAFLWAGMAGSFFILLMSRFAAGLFGANISTASAYMADITSPADRAKGMGLIGAAFGLGFIFGPAIGGLLIPYGHEWPSLVAGMICLANFGLAIFLLPEPLSEQTLRAANRRRFDWNLFKRSLISKSLVIPMVAFFLVTFAFVQLEITFGLFVLDRFFFSEQDAGFLLAFLGVMMALVQGVLLGPLVKRFKEVSLVFWGSLFAAVGLAVVATSFVNLQLYLGLVMLAVGYSLMNPCLSSIVSKAAPAEKLGSTMGIYQSWSSMARVLAPLIAGGLYDRGQHWPYVMALGLVFVVSLMFVSFKQAPVDSAASF